jgi:hypothetical protein
MLHIYGCSYIEHPFKFCCAACNPSAKRLNEAFIQCIQKVALHLQKLLDVMSTSVYIGLNPFNCICKQFLQSCVSKVAVHLQKVLEVMSRSCQY